jgi:hypothetical protein
LDKKYIADLVPFSHVFSTRRNHKKKNPFFLLSSHATTQEVEVQGRLGGSPQTKPKIITSYNKFMGVIDSSDMMLYTYLDERQAVHYWEKVAFNIIASMVMNGYRGPGKLKSRYSYRVSIIKSLGEEWLAPKDNTGADDPQGP